MITLDDVENMRTRAEMAKSYAEGMTTFCGVLFTSDAIKTTLLQLAGDVLTLTSEEVVTLLREALLFRGLDVSIQDVHRLYNEKHRLEMELRQEREKNGEAPVRGLWRGEPS